MKISSVPLIGGMRTSTLSLIAVLVACQANAAREVAGEPARSEFGSLEHERFQVRHFPIVLDSTTLDSVQKTLGGRIVELGQDGNGRRSLCYRIGDESSGMAMVLESDEIASFTNSVNSLVIGTITPMPTTCANVNLRESDVRLPFGLSTKLSRAELVRRLGSAHRQEADSSVSYEFQRQFDGRNSVGETVRFDVLSQLEAIFRNGALGILIFRQTTTA